MKVLFKDFTRYINIPSGFGFIQNGLTEIANKVATIPNFPDIPTIKVLDGWYKSKKLDTNHWWSLKDYIAQARQKLIVLLERRLHYTEQRIVKSKGNNKFNNEANNFYNDDKRQNVVEQLTENTATNQVHYKDNELLIDEVRQFLDELISFVENFLFTFYYEEVKIYI